DADLKKKNDASMDPLSVGGKELNVGEYNFSYALKNDNKFSGSAQANQSNSLSGSITVEVIEILANGNLVIRGEKWLSLNTGDEYIRLSGTIRPDDIDFDNTIASNRISNARIQYSGTGTNQDMQEPGFLARFFNVSL
ncbi:flagellar basal body L-ring protein FlgH, partial [Vibrio fluvialis]|nr:flagellar basal body L-ring protein FlgH [Vibrio fluvialis]